MSLTKTNVRVHYPALDVLRGLAICFVVFYHNFGFLTFFKFGWMGVDLFFVLSGYLITDLLMQSRENRYFFRNFYIRRALRIFPLYYLVLIAFFTLSPTLFSQKGPGTTFSYYNDNKTWFWSYFQNWLMVFKGAPPVPFLAHFWSLAVEEQFYIFWPLIIFFVRPISRLRKLIIGLILFSVVLRILTWALYPNDVEVFYCNTLTRMDSLLMGSLLAVHLKEGRSIPSSLIKLSTAAFILLISCSLIIFGNVRQDNLIFPTIGYSVSALFFTCMLYLILKNEKNLTGWIKHLHPLSFIGKISYGIYVYHIPIYLVLSATISELLASHNTSFISSAAIISMLSLVLTIAASTISFYYIEKPILNLKKHFP